MKLCTPKLRVGYGVFLYPANRGTFEPNKVCPWIPFRVQYWLLFPLLPTLYVSDFQMVRENNPASPANVWNLPTNSSSTEASSSNSPSPVAETQPEKQLDITSNRSQRKRPVTTGVWPCKIHGCNKQFAREADLKRHQRTTKMHSMPSLQVHFFKLLRTWYTDFFTALVRNVMLLLRG